MDRRRLSAFANYAGYTDAMGRINQSNTEQRRLSDGPYPAALRLPHNYLHYPGEFGGSESSRRASYCGEPDPTIQLAPNGQSGSLYLLPAGAASNESSLSNGSYDEQRRTLTIYDGRVPTAPTAPAIPFELMTPLDAISQTMEDPIESFVQIVLEEPEERPPIIRPLSPPRRSSSPRHRHRRNSSNLPTSPKPLTETQSMPVTDFFNTSEISHRAPQVIEPMDFSFLEPVLRGESAAPPSLTHRSRSLPQPYRQISPQNSSASEDSAIDLRPPSRSSHRITILEDHSSSSTAASDYVTTNSSMVPGRLKVPSSMA